MRKMFTPATLALLASAVFLAPAFAAESAKDYFAAASESLTAKDYPAATAAYAKAEELSVSKSSKSDAANGAGHALIKMRNYSDAITSLGRAVEINPASQVAWNNLGYAHLKMYETGLAGVDSLGKAAEAFTKVGEIDANYHPENLKLVQGMLEQEKVWTEAAKAREGQPAQAPDPKGSYTSYREAGNAAEQEGAFELAKANFMRAEATANTKKGRSIAANMLGLLALKARQPKAAVEALRRSAEMDPTYKYAWNNLGVALIKLYESGDGGTELVQEAVAAFKKVAEIDPTYKAENMAWAEGLLAEIQPPVPVAEEGVSATPAE